MIFDTYQAAEILGLSHWMVRKHCAAGHIAATQLGKGGHWIIEQAALDAFIAGTTFRRHRNRKYMPRFAIDLSEARAILEGAPVADLESTLEETLAILEGRA